MLNFSVFMMLSSNILLRYVEFKLVSLEVVALENVLGFRPILPAVMAFIRANIPGSCT